MILQILTLDAKYYMCIDVERDTDNLDAGL